MKRAFVITAVLILFPAMVVHKTLRVTVNLTMDFLFFPFQVLAACAKSVAKSL